MSKLEFIDVAKSYEDVQVLFGINLFIEEGDLVVFVGPSGCGKSTLLRMIAGLEDITSGTITIGGAVVNDVMPAKRGVAMVFQSYALYPHMTAYENMAFALRQARVPKDEIDQRVRAAAASLQIGEYLERRPRHLSGGQRQRVAIGRAIVREPKVFLFDEPLSNLDAALRSQTRVEIAELHARLGTTMIYVTHDQIEALTLADKIVVLNGGRVEQVGTPMKLYHHPDNRFVAGFIGSPQMNFFVDEGDLSVAMDRLPLTRAQNITLGIRPEHLSLAASEEALISGILRLVEQFGEYDLAYLTSTGGTDFIAKVLPGKAGHDRGSLLRFTAEPAHMHLFDNSTGLRVQ